LKLKAAITSIGSFFSLLLGGWDILLKWLLIFMIVDYATGMINAAINKKLSSKIGFIGITRKIGILVVVAISHGLDQLFADPEANVFNVDMPLIRTVVIWAYIVNEIVSILENVKGMGVSVPLPLQKVLDLIQDRTEEQKERG
jgi:toxin secretion/phage lysis holin